ncbi:MAG TPA: hypothetical protein VNK96_07410 [Fimbriimonadales bacterium]|nr:hypothetical protein [Fimbriimonadales bacterium]
MLFFRRKKKLEEEKAQQKTEEPVLEKTAETPPQEPLPKTESAEAPRQEEHPETAIVKEEAQPEPVPQKKSRTTTRHESSVLHAVFRSAEAPPSKKRVPKQPPKITKRGNKTHTPTTPYKPRTSPFTADLTPVPIPEHAPRVVRINDRPTMVLGKRVLTPFIFFGNPRDPEREETTFKEIEKASASGVKIFSLMIDFEVDEESAKEAINVSSHLLNRLLEINPDAYIIFRLVFAGKEGWERKYPNAVYRNPDGTLAEPSVCDDAFWGEAARLLAIYINGLRSLPYAEHVLGLHLDKGEWFYPEGCVDTSTAAEEWFRQWTRHRYGDNLVALQASWFNGRVRFDNLKIPDYTLAKTTHDAFLMMERRQHAFVDYHLFISDATVARIQKLAWEVKKASEGNFLVAVSYGYTFEWSHPLSGHLSLGKLLRAREVDIICAPPSYRDRHMGGAASIPIPVDSLALNGKLFISEEDFKVPISKESEPDDDFNPPMNTPKALEAAHWRGLGAALAHASGIQWMDLWGNGWLNTPVTWQRGSQILKALICSLAVPVRDPDVAVLIDERSLAYLSDPRAFKLLIQDSREAVLRAGVSVGFYLLSDLAHRKRFPEAKLYIFLNAWDIRPEVRTAIKNRLQCNGKTLFWVYSAGLFESGRPALERVREVTGIAIRPQPFLSRAGTTILNRKHPLTELLEERALSVVEQLEPSYFAIPEEGCTVLGEYTVSGLPSLVVREIQSEEDPSQHWRSVFFGEPIINEKVIRGLCALAGVPVWNYHGDVVHVRPPFLCIHYSGEGQRTVMLPERWNAYDLISGKMIGADTITLKSRASEGTTQLLIVGEEREIQKFIEADTEKLLTIDSLPETEPDTIDIEQSAVFDIPIMSLPKTADIFPFFPEIAEADGEEEELEEKEVEEKERVKPEQYKRKPRVAPSKPSSKAGRKKTRKQTSEEQKPSLRVTFRKKE